MGKIFFRQPFRYEYKHRVIFIILLNFAVYGIAHLYREIAQYIYTYGPMNPVAVYKYHMYWQFLTYMFVHDYSNIRHILFNMLGLLVFGLQLEKAIGSKEFVLFYLLCGILSCVFSYAVYFFTGQYKVSLLGASGAVYAVLFAYAVFFPRSVIFIWGLIPVPAPVLVLIYAAIEFFSQFNPASGVAHMTHLFGFLAAWLYFVIRMGIHPLKIWRDTYR